MWIGLFFCVLEQVVGSASTNSLLLARSVGLFGAGVVTKTAHQQFHASVYQFHTSVRFKNAKDILCIQQDIRSVVHLLHITLGHLNCEWGHETGV